jgi:hypothetical protein
VLELLAPPLEVTVGVEVVGSVGWVMEELAALGVLVKASARSAKTIMPTNVAISNITSIVSRLSMVIVSLLPLNMLRGLFQVMPVSDASSS